MTSLAFKFEEITARELKPELYELEGISRATIEAHYKLYQGYVTSGTRSSGSSRTSISRAPTRCTRISVR